MKVLDYWRNINMSDQFEFISQTCTTREQSERLLSLGLKKETADCGHFYGPDEHLEYYYWETQILEDGWKPYWEVTDNEIPAWSFYRLIEIGFPKGIGLVVVKNGYDAVISLIEKRIRNGVLNKDYLEE